MTSPAIQPDAPPDPASPPVRGPGLRREALIALAIAATLAALGVPLGLLWRAVAPRVEFVVTEFGATTVQQEPEGFVADDGWYVLITFTVGVLAAIAAWALVRRRRGPLILLGLAAGCIVGGVLTSWVGHQIGYAHYRDLAAHAPVGTHFFRPPGVRSGHVGLWLGFLPKMQGAVLVQAVAAAMTYVMLAAFHVDPGLRHPLTPADELPAEPPEAWVQLTATDEDAGEDAWKPAQPTTAPPSPGDELSSGQLGSTAPPASPAPPGSGPAAPPRD